MEREEFILPDWSPPYDPAYALPAEGRHVPSDNDDEMMTTDDIFF